MSFDAGSVTSRFILDDSDYAKGQKRIEKSNKGMAKSFVVGQLALAGLNKAFGFVKKNIGDTIKKASDLQEETNKFNVVFSNVGKSAAKMRKDLQESFGLSKISATEMLGATGDLLTGFGFAQDSALNLSNEVQKLAVDLASFTNFSGGAKGASEALTKALLGERESLKSLGIAISEADVKAKLASAGQDKLTGSALRQAKAQATMQIAIEQSKNAIGDFARSNESLANIQRVLAARTEDLKAKIGEVLLPIITLTTKKTLEFVTKLNEVDFKGIVIKAISGFGEFEKALAVKVLSPLRKMTDFFRFELPKVVNTAVKVIVLDFKRIGVVAQNIFNPSAIKKGLDDISFEIEKTLFETTQTFKNWGKKREDDLKKVFDTIDARTEEWGSKFTTTAVVVENKAKETAEEIADAITPAINKWVMGFQAIKNAADSQGGAIKAFFEGVGGEILSMASSITSDFGGMMNDLFDVFDMVLNNELEALQLKNEIELEELQTQKDNRLALQQEEFDQQMAQLLLQREMGLISEKEFLIRKEEIEKNNADATAKIEKDMNDQIAKTKANAREKENAKKKEIFEANKANQIAQVWVQFALGAVASFAQGIAQLGPIAGAIIGAVMTAALLGVAIAQTVVISQQQFIPERAEGGRASGMTRINEKGGEIVSLPDGSIVIPNDISRKIAMNTGSAGGGMVINANFRGANISDNMSLRKVSAFVTRDISRKIRART